MIRSSKTNFFPVPKNSRKEFFETLKSIPMLTSKVYQQEYSENKIIALHFYQLNQILSYTDIRILKLIHTFILSCKWKNYFMKKNKNSYSEGFFSTNNKTSTENKFSVFSTGLCKQRPSLSNKLDKQKIVTSLMTSFSKQLPIDLRKDSNENNKYN